MMAINTELAVHCHQLSSTNRRYHVKTKSTDIAELNLQFE